MLEERISQLASLALVGHRCVSGGLKKDVEDAIRLAIKESSQEKDEVIRLLAKDETLHGEDASKVIKCLRELRAL